ncbi:MAG TPA: class I SAM-dependent methyltransferase [Longimicrobiales bacterium]|nr:class I SAM-dependent methyltransferase [Longimicrobiales bacterium]
MKTPGTDPGEPPARGADSPAAPAAAPAGFFDDDYRRLLEPFHPEVETRHEVAALRELVALAQDDRILDLGCGWGRHLSLLASAGHDVTGVDLSPALLRQVPPVRDPEPGSGDDARRPSLAAGDMRALPFADATFDVVLNLATSLGLFLEDDPARSALAEACRVLRPGGRLLIEGMHRDDVIAHFAPRARWRLEDGTEVRARRRFNPLRGVSHEVLRWRGPDGDGVKRHALRIRSATEIAGLLESAGFEGLHAFGDWYGTPFGPADSRLLILATPR